jgi:transcriptional regulator with XRE-family HTH domain
MFAALLRECLMTSAEQFKSARQLHGWSQSRLAGGAGVSATTIGCLERGMRCVPAPIVSTIRRVLAEAAIEFVDGEPQIGLKK